MAPNAQQLQEIDALTTWLRSLSPEEYRSRVLNLAGWLDVLELTEATDDLKGYVQALSAGDDTEE